jgi:putative SOS response-associated peptidase YedK
MDDPLTFNINLDEEKGCKGINLLHIAGLYNVWQYNDKVIYSYTVITMESNNTLNWLHHRMPAILDKEELIEVCVSLHN